MRFIFIILSVVFVLLGAGCASSNPTIVHQINDLASPIRNSGSFNGFESLARPINGQDKKRINILYVHGIGWTENADSPELGNSFLKGIAKAYHGVNQDKFVINRCRLKHHDTSAGETDHTFIETKKPVVFNTGLAGSALSIKNLACMDKQILDTDHQLEFVVYRVFWDEAFWKALQAPHVGYDDAYGRNTPVAPLRKKYNRKFKDDIVNYGFSDAVMYLGPAGAEIREAVHGAICAAILDANGTGFKTQGHIVTKQEACNGLNNLKSKPSKNFVFVSESLGSKILFDVFRETMNDPQYDVLDTIIGGSEIFMFANQIPLLSLADLKPVAKAKSKPIAKSIIKNRPKIIALSELNDFLSYELVPFYETLYSQSISVNGEKRAPNVANLSARDTRMDMVERVGFDIIDMRIEFADPLFPVLKSLVDPKQAHSDHAKQPKLMKYLLCGATVGKLNTNNCIAAKTSPKK